MKKFSFILVAVLLVVAILGTTYYIRTQNEQNPEISIEDAFNSSGAKMIVNELYFFARATKDLDSIDDLSSVCEEVFKALEIIDFTQSTHSTDSLIKTELNGIAKDDVKVSAMASIVGDNLSSKDKYITIDASGSDQGNALALRQKIEEALSKYDLKAKVNSCITGTYDGNLADSQLEGICRKILNESEAKKVDSLRFPNVISVSAFTPMIKDRLSIDGKNVNLSLAIRYNKLENKTYLWVATPIVNSEF